MLPLWEKIKGIPALIGIRLSKEPEYCLVFRQGHKEIRHYESYVEASTWVAGSFEQATNAGFRRLASYIGGANQTRKSIAMTIPVLQQPKPNPTSLNELGWQTSFILPAEYNIYTAPQPNNADILLESISDRSVAVIKFTGNISEKAIEEKLLELSEWLKELPSKDVIPSLASYDPPLTLSFRKRHELWINSCYKSEK